jgi:L-lysine exporter family protein LysE/ArgO
LIGKVGQLNRGKMMILAIVKGFTIGLAMIVPIGVQNSFLLSQGIKQNFHFTAATLCIFCDILLMSLGIFGGGALFRSHPLLATLITWGGVLFLTVYGAMLLKAVISSNSQVASKLTKPSTRFAVILTTLAVTLLNPHVYLDTVMIIGSISGQFATFEDKWAFLIGTALASIVWFYSLTASAARLSPWLSKNTVQRVINFTVAMLMWSIALSLVI